MLFSVVSIINRDIGTVKLFEVNIGQITKTLLFNILGMECLIDFLA